MLNYLLSLLLAAAALVLVASLYSGIALRSFGAAIVAALVLSLLNVLVRPALLALALPASPLLMLVVILLLNGLLFWLAGKLLPGFWVRDFVAAMIGALIYSILCFCIMYFLPGFSQSLAL